jgi:hypothetical protein
VGLSRSHQCLACGYDALVSGGPDTGLACNTDTIVCFSCRTLHDVVTLERLEPYPGLDGLVPVKELPLRCPIRKRHRVRPWRTGDPCPRCEGAMQPGGIMA